VEKPWWAAHILQMFGEARAALGHQTRGLRLWSGCTGAWSEGRALQVLRCMFVCSISQLSHAPKITHVSIV
jgi:hypothetical protein